MNFISRTSIISRVVMLTLSLNLLSTQALGQYAVGESISQQTRDRVLEYCSNGTGSETLGNLLIPGEDEPTRVLWLSFFASW